MEHLSNGNKECSNQHKNSQKLCNKMGHPVVNLMESQWKLEHNMIRNSQWKKVIVEQILVSDGRKKTQKCRTMIITVWGFIFVIIFILKSSILDVA